MSTNPYRPQLGEAHHYAYVVEDIKTTVSRLSDQFGAGPFFVIEGVPLGNVRSRGEPAEFAHNSAFGACCGGVIELIQPVRLAPQRVEERFAGPLPRIHHVAYVLSPADVANARRALDEHGLAQYLSSWLGDAETTLHDASAILGHDIEVHADNEGLHGFFGMVRGAAEGWDGADPLRRVDV